MGREGRECLASPGTGTEAASGSLTCGVSLLSCSKSRARWREVRVLRGKGLALVLLKLTIIATNIIKQHPFQAPSVCQAQMLPNV